MSGDKRQRAAVTVFAEVNDAVDRRDAAGVVGHLIRQALPIGAKHEVDIQAGTWTVTIHDVIENGMAAGNGYLWTEPTSKAYTQYDWQHDSAAPS